ETSTLAGINASHAGMNVANCSVPPDSYDAAVPGTVIQSRTSPVTFSCPYELSCQNAATLIGPLNHRLWKSCTLPNGVGLSDVRHGSTNTRRVVHIGVPGTVVMNRAPPLG